MLKNVMPLTKDDEHPDDWSYWTIQIQQLGIKRLNALNEGKRKKARELWFAIQEAELELGKAIDRVK